MLLIWTGSPDLSAPITRRHVVFLASYRCELTILLVGPRRTSEEAPANELHPAGGREDSATRERRPPTLETAPSQDISVTKEGEQGGRDSEGGRGDGVPVDEGSGGTGTEPGSSPGDSLATSDIHPRLTRTRNQNFHRSRKGL